MVVFLCGPPAAQTGRPGPNLFTLVQTRKGAQRHGAGLCAQRAKRAKRVSSIVRPIALDELGRQPFRVWHPAPTTQLCRRATRGRGAHTIRHTSREKPTNTVPPVSRRGSQVPVSGARHGRPGHRVAQCRLPPPEYAAWRILHAISHSTRPLPLASESILLNTLLHPTLDGLAPVSDPPPNRATSFPPRPTPSAGSRRTADLVSTQ